MDVFWLWNARQRPSVSGEHHDVRHRHLLYGRATGPNGCQFSVRMRIGGPCLAHRLPRGRTSASARDISSTSKRLLSINQTREFFFFPFYLCVFRSVYLIANFPVSLSLPALFLADLFIFPSSLTQMGYGWKLMRVTNEEDIFVRNNAP